jgi:uncharacterized protein (TIGR02271 family)
MGRSTKAKVSSTSGKRGARGAVAGTDLTELSEALRRSAGASSRASGVGSADAAAVVPVIAEELAVGRREVETGRVRLTKQVHERQEVVDQPTVTEDVVVERVPVNRVVEAAPAPRQEGDTWVVPVMEEVVVVERRLVLKEEVRITRRRTESHDPQTVTLRSEEVRIDRIPARPGGGGT